ncbi:SDR family NAD(P)-dependent oxidoreductase, partial [bacterium]|nr:SDR family NAD(P)-dependent oxidoreductase [bacterium]
MTQSTSQSLALNQFKLHGQTAIVTGGSKGLGEAMASGLASGGANVVIISRNCDEAKAVASRIADEYGVRAIGLKADVTDQEQTE